MTAARPRRRWLVFVTAWLGFALLAGAWAVANPVSASPDEPAQIIKAAAVARGQVLGTATEQGLRVEVPAWAAWSHAATCMAFHPEATADCQGEPPRSSELVEVETQAGFNNPIFYAIVGLPSLVFEGTAGIISMRIANALLTGAVLALGLMIASTFRRGWMAVLGVAVASTPMLVFLAGSVNPNSLEAAGVITAAIGLLAIVGHDDDRLRAERVAVVVVAATLAANTRMVSPLWLLIVVVIALSRLPDPAAARALLRHRSIVIGLVLTVVGVLIAVIWSIAASRIDQTDGVDDYRVFPGVGTAPVVGFLVTLSKTFDHGVAMIGNFGWLDTPVPYAVLAVWTMLVGALLVVALVALRGRPLVTALIAIGAFLLAPALLQGVFVTGGGYIWQGRYALPVFGTMVVVLALLLAERLPLATARRLAPLVLLPWAAAQTYAFAVNAKRYASGIDGTWGALLDPESWAPPGGNVLWIGVVLVVSLGSALGLWALSTTTANIDSSQTADSRSSSDASRV